MMPTPLDDADRLAVPPTVISRRVGDRSLLLNAATGRYFTLDEVSARIWALVGETPNVGALCGRLLSEFDIDADTVRRDLTELVSQLLDAGLLEVTRA